MIWLTALIVQSFALGFCGQPRLNAVKKRINKRPAASLVAEEDNHLNESNCLSELKN